ncbi:MAG TPA: GNAT family N-acetyltransferase [Ignavibacteriales bacterium]|nr:GNAT family N-acetyltransferase [Ignavibacteriales bacterium]
MNRETIKDLRLELENWKQRQEPDKNSACRVLSLAEEIISSEDKTKVDEAFWHEYLDLTRHSVFLRSLDEMKARYRWADTAFEAIRLSNYSLKTLFDQRIQSHPERILFTVTEDNKLTEFSYRWVSKRARQIASVLYEAAEESPRVAIFSENTIESASCDLACLLYDIFDTPLNIHFSSETVADIFSRTNINIAVTDSETRLNLLLRVREKLDRPFKIVYIGYDRIDPLPEVYIMEKLISEFDPARIDMVLSGRKKLSLDDPATVLFTSGSTGQAKGVVFTMYNLITKRFARAAALPEVGEKELLLCYLPLYHTFGRYLEMMGMIFWGGTYVFAGNPSIETLLSMMQKVNPTGIISIPLRLVQIRDKFLHQASKTVDRSLFRELTGKYLRWGLSAAGYLDPKVFQFFHEHDVELCSGFGMTEATGGICMTPPGEYVKNSVGIPLPGIQMRLNSKGELEISGHYVATYLDDDVKEKNDGWMPTGDLFKTDKNGHYHIVDRIKDIYKNIKGQTIAPRPIEKMFDNIPGFKRTFLCGDGMAYNTLLIVPDTNDAILQKALSKKKQTDYFRPIIASANRELAPYERIVDFSILDRDFEEQRGELTSKGSMRRKAIENSFSGEIGRMYRYPNVDFKIDTLKIIIPRWVIRDLGITEYDIKSQHDGLYNKLNNTRLTVKLNSKTGRVQVGDFEYVVTGEVVDLGTFIRQPMLWTGNISLINFALCKDGWDTPYEKISPQVFLSSSLGRLYRGKLPTINNKISEAKLKELNDVIVTSIYGRGSAALDAVTSLEKSLHTESHRVAYLIRRRLEALSQHPDFEVRSYAYKILLFDEPWRDYSRYLPAFITSGLPFINKKSIEQISQADFERGRLEALRQRLESYRTTLDWNSSVVTVTQFKRILELLVHFARHNRNSYGAVREELVSWILHKKEPQLSSYAQELFNKLAAWFESTFELSAFEDVEENWEERVVFQEDFTTEEIKRIEKVLFCSTFLKESLLLIFEEDKFSLKQVPPEGIWISRILSPHNSFLYRISINTVYDKHYDLMLLIKDDITRSAVRETIYWMIKISGYPGASSVMPKFGNFRSPMGAASLAYVNDLTVWDKIRDYSSVRTTQHSLKNEYRWKALFVRAFIAFLKAWQNSGYALTPGSITPTNVVVPEADLKLNSRILSLSGWKPYDNTLSIIYPFIKNFYLQTIGNYPWNKDAIKIEWMFDAAIEAFSKKRALRYLEALKNDLMNSPARYEEFDLKGSIDRYIEKRKNEPYKNLALLGAIERYNEWISQNPESTSEAREQFIRKLYTLYQLNRFPAITRYMFYQKTYFANADELVREKFSRLVQVMFEQPEVHATRLVELSELQDALTSYEDRQVFSKLVFPDVSKRLQMELIPVGEDEKKSVIVKTLISDRRNLAHVVRQALSPFEVGNLNRLFILDDYPVNITSEDHFLILTDNEGNESVNGGICYKILDSNVAHLEGIVVAAPFRGRGIGSVLLEDFCNRLRAEGIQVLTTHFYLTSFFSKHMFRVDSRWGGLVRFLT